MSSIETILDANKNNEKPSFKELPEHQELNLDGIDELPLPWARSEKNIYVELGPDGKITELKSF